MAKEISFSEFSNYLEKTFPALKENLEKTIKLCCKKVSDDIKEDMKNTPRDTSKVYFTNNKTKAHHPSLPGNPPAPDSGNLRRSIRYEIHDENDIVYGIVGNTQKDSPYGEYLEYGTSKIAPRPWLRPTMIKNEDWVRRSIAKAVVRGIKLKGVNE